MQAIELNQDVISKVERDLNCYPDWIVRLEVSGLGVTSKAFSVGSGSSSIASLVERDVELSEEIKKKIVAIEKVYDRLHGKMKDLIEYRYFRRYGRDEVRALITHSQLGTPMGKRWYYELRNRALESFARALGYIE